MRSLVIVKARLLDFPAFVALNAPISLIHEGLDPKLPSVAIELIGGNGGLTHSGPHGLERDLVRLHCRAGADEPLYHLVDATYRALHGFRGFLDGCEVDLIQHRNRITNHDPSTDIFRQIEDYRIHYKVVS